MTPEEWERLAFNAWVAGIKSIGHCNCSMDIKLTGDGCDVCNPTLKREIECYNEGHTDAAQEIAKVVATWFGEQGTFLHGWEDAEYLDIQPFEVKELIDLILSHNHQRDPGYADGVKERE